MRTRMSAGTFERFIPIARVIASDQTPEWLPRLLHSWICDLHRARFVEPERPTRTEMREKLNRFEEAASLLREQLASPYIREFLELDPNDVSLERHQIMSVLEDLARWANQARNCNTLVTEAGVTKAGSGRARSVASVSAPMIIRTRGSLFTGRSRRLRATERQRPPKRIGARQAAIRMTSEKNRSPAGATTSNWRGRTRQRQSPPSTSATSSRMIAPGSCSMAS
jgi:hypothetical protein